MFKRNENSEKNLLWFLLWVLKEKLNNDAQIDWIYTWKKEDTVNNGSNIDFHCNVCVNVDELLPRVSVSANRFFIFSNYSGFCFPLFFFSLSHSRFDYVLVYLQYTHMWFICFLLSNVLHLRTQAADGTEIENWMKISWIKHFAILQSI